MFTGTALGKVLAPHIVFKAEHICDSWCNGGPQGERYNYSKSDWFDNTYLQYWFSTVILPY